MQDPVDVNAIAKQMDPSAGKGKPPKAEKENKQKKEKKTKPPKIVREQKKEYLPKREGNKTLDSIAAVIALVVCIAVYGFFRSQFGEVADPQMSKQTEFLSAGAGLVCGIGGYAMWYLRHWFFG